MMNTSCAEVGFTVNTKKTESLKVVGGKAVTICKDKVVKGKKVKECHDKIVGGKTEKVKGKTIKNYGGHVDIIYGKSAVFKAAKWNEKALMMMI